MRRKQSRLSVDPNDSTMQCPVAHPETEGMMASAEEVFQALRSHFETEAWRQDAERSRRAVSAIYQVLPLGGRGRDRAAERG